MRAADITRYAGTALRGYPTRSVLMIVAMAIGVAAVVVLTALGDGARRYVINQFSAIGTHLVIVFPGRSETAGASPGALVGETPRDLTLDDALALARSRAVARIAPLNVGTASASWRGRSREVPVLGSTHEFQEIRRMEMAQGRFLPAGDPARASPVAVVGAELRKELFGASPAVGEWIRLGDRRFRVVGVLAPQGQSLGFNTDELAIIPVASAQSLFNTTSLFRILVEARSRPEIVQARDDVIRILKERHEGEEDVTVVTQDAVLATFDRVLRALTFAVAGIAAISLGVAGILIMNVMLVAVAQRRAEIGLLKAVGATARQIRTLFFAEALGLSMVGAIAGLGLGELGSFAIRQAYPVLPAVPPVWAVGAAVATAVVTGVAFSTMPARRAARLDPVQALARR